jgi:hypothetical protein
MNRKTALKLVERKAFGGSHFDSFMHADIFRSSHPQDFGVMEAQMFSSDIDGDKINKKWMWHTAGQNNMYYTDPGVSEYKWSLMTSSDVRARIMFVDPNLVAQPGKGLLQFKVYLDINWFHEPVLLKTENANAPMLRIIGHPIPVGNYYEYIVQLQTSDPNAWIDPSYLQVDRFLVDASTSVSDELNTKYGGDQYGSMFSLQSHIGYVARKVEFTDKFIRMEIGCREKGQSMPKGMGYSFNGKQCSDAVGVGYVYQPSFTDQVGKKIEKGAFISSAEARLAERIMMDCEVLMEFGHLENGEDQDTNRTRRVAPGWRQLVRDGWYHQHNGNLTLSFIVEFINSIFITRKSFKNRRIKIATGEGGIEFFHQLLAQEAATFQIVSNDIYFGKRSDGKSGFHDNELTLGFQFTQLKAVNGLIIELVYDPMKDDPFYFPEKAPGSNYTVESFSFDIMDFGISDAAPNNMKNRSNISMVSEMGAEEYYMVSNVYDIFTGAKKDGSNAYSNNKEVGIYRGKPVALAIWDVTRVGRIEYVPSL